MRAFLLLILALIATPLQAERLKDLGSFAGVRGNQLTGYGVVVGLAGTGDDSLDYSTLGIRGALQRFGMTVPAGSNPSLKNSAAVIVTADLPAFAKPGTRLDVTVSALGKAKSLRGGTLVMAPLQGADGQVYAMAQGNLVVGGLGVDAADGSKVTVNVPSVGRIDGGATIERAVETGFATSPTLTFNLANADLTNAGLVADSINRSIGSGIARAVDGVSITIAAPEGAEARTALMSRVENLLITPAAAAAKVIVNSRTGTVVINGAVRIMPAAVTHGKLTVRIDEKPQVSQPAPFSSGQTTVTPNSQIVVEEKRTPAFIMKGASLSEIVAAINRLGVGSGDLVAILEALKQAGALQGELVIL
ncbi:Flagellar P-ring protein [Sphingomonas antarctica]|uniref:flagellar basal body P-ring protein FlgI n=1 Tax=Sphingomonas antarctica TaxID=2040274 RepID=UPI0039E7DB0A